MPLQFVKKFPEAVRPQRMDVDSDSYDVFAPHTIQIDKDDCGRIDTGIVVANDSYDLVLIPRFDGLIVEPEPSDTNQSIKLIVRNTLDVEKFIYRGQPIARLERTSELPKMENFSTCPFLD